MNTSSFVEIFSGVLAKLSRNKELFTEFKKISYSLRYDQKLRLGYFFDIFPFETLVAVTKCDLIGQ